MKYDNLTNAEYENLSGIRVSSIVEYATKDINTIIKNELQEKEYTDSILLGLAAHALILRKNKSSLPQELEIIDADSYRTKDAQAQKQEALDNGKIPLLKKNLESLETSIKRASAFLNCFFNPSECEFEVAFSDDDATFGSIKGRLDAIQNGNVINDLKVSRDCTSNLDKKIFDSGYQLQMFLYMTLSGIREANLVFFNPDTALINVKRLDYAVIKDECVALLGRAQKNMELLERYREGNLGVIEGGEYQTPQWAYHYLLENE